MATAWWIEGGGAVSEWLCSFLYGAYRTPLCYIFPSIQFSRFVWCFSLSEAVSQSPFPQRKVSSMSLCAQSCNISYFFSARVGTLRVEVSHISPWFLLLSGSVFIPPTCLGSLHLHVPVSHLERYGSRNFCASSSWSLWVPFDVFIRTLIFRLLPFSFRDTSPSWWHLDSSSRCLVLCVWIILKLKVQRLV